MARIAGVDLPKEKRIEVALTYLYGIGPSRSRVILENTGVDPSRRAVDLTDDDVNKLRQEIEGNYKVEGALRTEVSMNIKRLMDVFEPTKMGDAPRGFDGETEFFGNLGGPVFHNFSLGQAVEGVVDLYRRKVLPIEGKHVPVGQLLGIEGSLPLLVAKAACTDA